MTVTITVLIDVPSQDDDAEYLLDLCPACDSVGQFAAELFRGNGVPNASAIDTTARVGDSHA